MAQEVQISPDSIERTAKIRHPVAVPALTVITDRDLRDLLVVPDQSRDGGPRPGPQRPTGSARMPSTSLLAFFPGFLIIVPRYVSLYNGSSACSARRR